MTAVNISGTFSKDQRPFCGLESIADELLDETKGMASYMVVAEIRPHSYVYRAEDGTKIPTVRFTHVEVCLDEADMKAVQALLTKLYAARTGSDMPAELPFDGDAFDAEGWAKEPKEGSK